MTKVLFMLSAVIMVIAGALSYKNRESLINLRTDRKAIDQKVSAAMDTLQRDAREVDAERGKLNAVVQETGVQEERLNQAKIKLTNAQRQAETAAAELSKLQEKIADYREKLDKLPKDITPENINEGLNKLKSDIASNSTKVEQIKEQVAAKEGDVKKAQDDLNSLVNRIETRSKAYNRNSFSSTVVAVNNDWGFVVIGSGTSSGITADTKLLVTRGNQTIARVNVVDVQGGRTLANIDLKSLRSGPIAPGDRVILETLYQ